MTLGLVELSMPISDESIYLSLYINALSNNNNKKHCLCVSLRIQVLEITHHPPSVAFPLHYYIEPLFTNYISLIVHTQIAGVRLTVTNALAP